MDNLLGLFPQELQTPLASINENDLADTASAMLMDDFSTNSLANYLINSLALKSNQITSPIIKTPPSQTQATPNTHQSTPSFSVGTAFAAEFGSKEIMTLWSGEPKIATIPATTWRYLQQDPMLNFISTLVVPLPGYKFRWEGRPTWMVPNKTQGWNNS